MVFMGDLGQKMCKTFQRLISMQIFCVGSLERDNQEMLILCTFVFCCTLLGDRVKKKVIFWNYVFYGWFMTKNVPDFSTVNFNENFLRGFPWTRSSRDVNSRHFFFLLHFA